MLLADGGVRRERQVVQVWGGQRIGLAKCQCTVAGPAVVARVGDHRGAQRIEFDVAVAVHQVVAITDQAGLVAALPQRARAVVGDVDIADIAPPEGLHGTGDRAGALWHEQQVHMVGHQRVGMDHAALAPCHVAQFAAIAEVVGVGEETGLAVVAALDDVLRNTGKIDAQWTGHGDGLRDESRIGWLPACRVPIG